MNASPLFLHFVILHGTPNFDSGGGECLLQGGVWRCAARHWPPVPRVYSRLCLCFSVPALSQALPGHAARVHVGDLVSAAALLGTAGEVTRARDSLHWAYTILKANLEKHLDEANSRKKNQKVQKP